MFWIWFLLATSQCALLYILARRGESMPRRIQDEAEANKALPEDKWPSVGLIVPVAGRDPRMEGALRSLLQQDYPHFVPVLVTAEETEPAANGRKARAVPVGQVSTPVVSSLPQPVSDSVLLARMAQTGYAGFHTAVGKTADGHTRNTIRACIHGDQTVISGQGVRMRLLEPMRVGKHVLPKNTLLTGGSRIQGERLNIGIVQVEYDGIIIPVELTVYDNDGQDGIFIPGSMEASAVKEVAANMGQNLGTSISITNQSAKDQLLSELGRGAIQGVSQYISKKLREEKVHLKSGHTLMLYQNDNQ